MDELIKAYIDFINELDPYWESYEDPENVIEIELPEMLYNLEEIYENLSETLSGEFDEDLYYQVEHLKALIARFKAAGVERMMIV